MDPAENLTLLYLLALIFYSCFGNSQGITMLGNNTDHQALLAFKSHIALDPLGVLESWNSTTSFCNWEGVTCNTTKQRVTSLNLANYSLSGSLAPHITNLSFLSVLNLQNNSFSGSIPRDIGKLFRLKFFLLGSNQLNGTIPASLSLCSRLVYVALPHNKIEGTIPPELGSLSQLQVLDLSENFLVGGIPLAFGNLSSLTNLLLMSNSLEGPIPEQLGRLPFLLNVQVGVNYLVGDVPKSLLNRSSLIYLSLSANFLTGKLPSDMFLNLPNLTTFFMGGNQLSGHIPSSLSNASLLERIDLSGNNLTGHIPLMGNLPNLEVLSLQMNELVSDGEDGLDFLTSLTNSTKLNVLALATNLLTGTLPSSVGNLSRQLSLFVLGENQLQGNFPREISNLVGLAMLSVEYNFFTGNIPPSIGSMPNLQNLYLHNNIFSGEIPESLGNLKGLSEISLMSNLLTGTIPPSLGNCEHLQVLDISENKLSGNIPKEIFRITNFGKLLNLSWNKLSGSLPREIGNLKMIQGVDLSVNKLSGDIPFSIGGCSSLIYLNLSQNSFGGSIPESLSSLKGMEYIDFSSNNLSGEIPASLGALRFLQILNLSKNQLKGQVPTSGIFRNETAVSVDGNPQLCGGIKRLHLPTCIPISSIKHTKTSKMKFIIGLVVGGVAILALSALLLMFARKRKDGKPAYDQNEEDDVIPHHTLYTFEELKIATRNFSPENLIGEGSFGMVYKGVFGDGTVAAIKVFKREQSKAHKSFLTECEALRNIRHRNLVKIITVCSSPTADFKALVLPYMPKGSLEHWLHGNKEISEHERRLEKRLDIVIEVALAVEYLHHDCESAVVHCDLKPSNVLLDGDLSAHVADFGLARILGTTQNERDRLSSTLGLKGSIGYIPPEYGFGGAVSTKGDVYSFGILVLEMFTRRKPTDEIFSGETDIQKWVLMGVQQRSEDIVDQELLGKDRDSLHSDCILGILRIGLRCAVKAPEARPSMREVSMMIKDVKAKHFN